MYINPEVWKQLRNRQGHGIIREAHEISVVVDAIAIGVAIGTIYSLAYKEAKRYLEHRDRIDRFKKQRRYRAV